MNINVAAVTVRREFNRPLYGNAGEFTLSKNISVPYFASIIEIKRAVSEFKTHEQVAPSLEQVYSLKELYQRQIDHKRVTRDLIDGYLKNPQKIKFFNSITIVLMPKSEDGHIASAFLDYPDNDPRIPYDESDVFDAGFASTHKVLFGGVQYNKSLSNGLARLRWDMNRVDAVAVDGQHRLSALQKWFDNDKKKSLEAYEQDTRIPIIILLLDKSAGFQGGSNGNGSSIKSIAREIFTDLNKNAKTVDKATEIILDDRSLVSCCVRSLVTEKTTTDQAPLLPLSLVRWKEANHRFDQEHYLNSLVHLNLLVEGLVNIGAPSDPMDADSVFDFIDKVDSTLGLSGNGGQLKCGDLTLKQYYKDNFLGTDGEPLAPFTEIPPDFMPCALSGFESRFKPWLLDCITKFKPHRDLLAFCRSNDVITGIFAQYLAQPEGHLAQLNKEMESFFGPNWKNDKIEAPKRATAQAKLRYSSGNYFETWAYKSIFQKSFVQLAKLVVFEYPLEAVRFGKIDDFMRFFDGVYDSGILDLKAKSPDTSMLVWTFIALNPASDSIKVNKKTEKRICAILALWYFAWRYITYTKTSRISIDTSTGDYLSVKEILKKFAQKQTQADWPVFDFHKEIRETFTNVAALILGKEREDVATEEALLTAESRMLQIVWAGLKWIPEAKSGDSKIEI
jgi:hypothetical protein